MPEDVQISEIEYDGPALRPPSLPTSRAKSGRAATKRQRAVLELIRQARAETRKAPDGRIEGPLRPCTIVNFNPEELVVEGQLNIKVPAAGATTHHQIRIPYKGRTMVGTYCYIASPMEGERRPDKEPIFYTTATGHERDQLLPVDVPVCEPRVFSPHSIGCELVNQYNDPNMKLMGGILFFDQGPHMLTRVNLEKTDGRIWVPTRSLIEDSWKYSYGLREALLEEELDRIFTAQLQYLNARILRADALWAEEDVQSRKQVTDADRAWNRFAVDNGYMPSLREWCTSRLTLGDAITTLKTCSYCGQQQTNPDVFFCKAGHPFDAFEAFMAGKVVPDAYLEMLEGEQLEKVLEIRNKRKARFEGKKSAKASKPSEEETAGDK